jgi:hypothetical protein
MHIADFGISMLHTNGIVGTGFDVGLARTQLPGPRS